MRKTKIVCTLGPSSSDKAILEEFVNKGMNVARLNFSHGTHESHAEVIKTLREISKKTGKIVSILQDLCGPKIRLGQMPNPPVTVNKGDMFTFVEGEITGDATRASISYDNLYKEVKPGERILIDDGLVEMKVVAIEGKEIKCEVVTGGVLSTHKGVNFPGTVLSIPALTEKDIDDLRFGLKAGVDMVAISFVRSEKDISKPHEVMKEEGRVVPIISKIEKQDAVNNFEEILHLSDGIMVARGDMGVELPFQEVPIIQKNLIKRCQEVAKPVITATQMLDSMIRNPMPTRAEVTDVANAILDGTDAIMLSGETASGKYPVLAVETMVKIAEYTEQFLPYEDVFTRLGEKRNAVEAISLATCEMAEQMQAEGIIVSTSSGRTARAVSKYKPRPPIIAVTDSIDTTRRLNLSWGVFPVFQEPSGNLETYIQDLCNAALTTSLVKIGDMVIITAGIPEGTKGSTNMIKLHILGHRFIRGIGIGASHVVTGTLRIVHNINDAKTKVKKGDIVLLPRFFDGLEEISIEVKGVIVEDASDLTSSGLILKQKSIPAIVGVPNALELLKDGETITIDSERGLIFDSGL